MSCLVMGKVDEAYSVEPQLHSKLLASSISKTDPEVVNIETNSPCAEQQFPAAAPMQVTFALHFPSVLMGSVYSVRLSLAMSTRTHDGAPHLEERSTWLPR